MTSHSSYGWIPALRIVCFGVSLSIRAWTCLFGRVKSLIRDRSVVLDMILYRVFGIFSLHTRPSWMGRPIPSLPVSIHIAEVGSAFLSLSFSSQHSLPICSELGSGRRFSGVRPIIESAKELLLLFAFLDGARWLLSFRFAHLFGFGASFDLFVVLALLDQVLHLLKHKRLKKLLNTDSRLRQITCCLSCL